jgi:ChpA-C
MKPWAKWTANTVLLTTGFAAAGGGLPGVAFAGTGGTHTGNASVLSGNEVNAPVSIPVNVCGNAAAILGIATAGCAGGAEVAGAADHHSAGSRTHGPSIANVSVGHDNVVKLPVEIAANGCGNSVGNATAHCRGIVTVPAGGWRARGTEPHRASLSAGNLSVGSGNDVQAPVSAPVNVCGNAAAVLGDSSAGCIGGATVSGHASHTYGRATKTPANGKSCACRPSKTQLAGLGALPGVATVPGLGDVAGLSPLNGLTGGSALIPVNTLSAYQEKAFPGAAGEGMSSNSFAALAIGALLAGAAALKLASRRPRGRKGAKARTGEVSV